MNSHYLINALNQVGLLKNLQICSLSTLSVNSTYKLTGIRKQETCYGSKVLVNLNDKIAVYLPARINKLLHANNRLFKSLHNGILKGDEIMLRYMGGKHNEIEFFTNKKGKEVKTIDEQKKDADMNKDNDNNVKAGSSRNVDMVEERGDTSSQSELVPKKGSKGKTILGKSMKPKKITKRTTKRGAATCIHTISIHHDN